MRSKSVLALMSVPLFSLAAFAQTAPAAAPAKPAAQTEQAPEPKFKVGDMAPDFTMKDQNRQDVTLSSFRGKRNVVLAFYIFAFTGG
jgi:cytochrome oxidase Cu insertion factor (SCO1/SenC/PrrC family)